MGKMAKIGGQDLTLCPHCKIPMSVGQNVYQDEDGDCDVEYYHYCDECGADYS